jgi:hypothetical protein
MSYDFNQTFTEGFTDISTATVTFSRTNRRILQGEFGPPMPGPEFPGDDAINVFTVCQKIDVNRAPQSAPAQGLPRHCFQAIA